MIYVLAGLICVGASFALPLTLGTFLFRWSDGAWWGLAILLFSMPFLFGALALSAAVLFRGLKAVLS